METPTATSEIGVVGRLTRIFYAPGEVYESLAHQRSAADWFVPTTIAALLGIVIAAATIPLATQAGLEQMQNMPAEQREPLVRFGNMCTNTRCPRAELYGRMEEVNAVCARQGHLRRELQILQPNGPRGGAPPTLAPLADHCSAEW